MEDGRPVGGACSAEGWLGASSIVQIAHDIIPNFLYPIVQGRFGSHSQS